MTSVPADLAATPPVNKATDGTYYLLSDEQVQLARKGKTLFRHLASRAIDQRGVESVAHISIEFDPSFETPRLHVLRVHRGSSVQDRVATAAIKFLQREKDLEARIYDGTQTIDITLDDIRPGDVVEYAYSLQGSNPVLAGTEYGRFNLQWSVPIAAVHRRLLFSAEDRVQWKGLGGAKEPQVIRGSGQSELVWNLRDVPGVSFPDETPRWWNPAARVEWAMYPDWAAVARWGERLYAAQMITDTALKREVERMARESPDPEQRIGAVLDFVQSNVRYLGIEIGPGSFAPRAPDVIFQRRFGDCKDKAMLAVAMLRALGVEAYPALVNTRLRARVDEHLPSPGMFDHVVFVARSGDRQWWLDPTRLPQKAGVNEVGQANFGKSLVLDGKSTGLTVIPVATASVNKKQVAIRVDASNGFSSPATVDVVTRYEGVSAERMRERLRTRDLDELQHDYENWYARDYRGLKRAAQMTVSDDMALNRVTTHERYELPSLVRRDQNDREVVWLFARDMKYLLSQPSDSVRSAPLAIDHPEETNVVLTAQLPDDRKIKEDSTTVNDSAFEFTRHTSQTGREIRMDYTYRTSADHVKPADLAAHITHLESARNNVGYTLRPKPSNAESDRGFARDIGPLGWMFLLLSLLTIVLKASAWLMRRARLGWFDAASYGFACAAIGAIAVSIVTPSDLSSRLALLALLALLSVLYGSWFFNSAATTSEGAPFGRRRGAFLSVMGLALTALISSGIGAAYKVVKPLERTSYSLDASGKTQLTRAEAEKIRRDSTATSKFEGLDKPLQRLEMPLPAYPAGMNKPENTGVVEVEFFIERDGSVREVIPVGAPHPLLAQISKETVLKWKFEPPISKGKPVRQLVTQEFRFKVE